VDDAQARALARVGQVLREKWTLGALLGVGGMATVYAATHRNKKRGAVKLLHPELSANVNMRQRFLREGYVANSVGQRGAVEVFDDDVTETGEAFLVMELLEGETLAPVVVFVAEHERRRAVAAPPQKSFVLSRVSAASRR